MYIPPAFAETDLSKLHRFIEQNSFGILVSQIDDHPFASHLPFLLDRTSGAQGSLVGHLARASPHWEQAAGQSVLAIFHGPHAYISPTWYEADQVVPTWNYVAVHAYGKFEAVEEHDAVLAIVERMVKVYENPMARPWSLGAPSTFLDRMLQQIVGFRIEIERLEGKWKLNQNHPAERRKKVIQALQERSDENSQAIAALMADELSRRY